MRQNPQHAHQLPLLSSPSSSIPLFPLITRCLRHHTTDSPDDRLPVIMPAKPRSYAWTTALKNVYNDPWKWQLVKSWSWFAAGIYIAREVTATLKEPVLP